MNQIPFNFASGQVHRFNSAFQSFGAPSWSNQLHSGAQSILGQSMSGPLPLLSSLMQNLFNPSSFGSGQFSMQGSPLASLFQQLSGGGNCGSSFGHCASPCSGSYFGGQNYGSYGCDSNYFSNNQGYGCPSDCQDFSFGQQCAPRCQDFHHQDFGNQYGNNCGNQGGQLQQDGEGKPITYTTSGGYTVNVNGTTINVTDPDGNTTIKTWGDPHENVNGKHVSDWQEKQRTLLLDDGTKITMEADNPKGVVENMSIFDGRQAIQIDNKENKVTNHTYNPHETRSLDRNQYDGSVARFSSGFDGSSTFANLYTQDENFNITRGYQLLATTNSQGEVTNHFDDPTHKNT